MSKQNRGGPPKKPRKKKKHNIAKDEEKQRQAVVLAFDPTAPELRSLRDVAKSMGVSVPAVTSLLQEAYKKGIFSVLRHLPEQTKQMVRLEALLKAKYGPSGLREVLLVEGEEAMLEDLDSTRRRDVHVMVIRSMARRLARYLDELITVAACRQRAAREAGKPVTPFRLGVAWGRTLHLVAERLLSTERRTPHLAMEVLPIIGVTSTYNREPIEANVIAMDFAKAYGAESRQLPCPAFGKKAEVDVITAWPQIADVLQKIREVDVAISSMGAILDDGDDDSDIRLSSDPKKNEELKKAARDAGAVAEINYWCFGPTGQVVWTPDRAIGLGLVGIRKIVEDAASGRKMILVSGGDKRRLEALRIALRAGFASVLVTDTVSARYLVADAAGERVPRVDG